MGKCKVAIVILHYESLDDTKECLDSIIKYIKGNSVQIVVVDNGSVNGKLKNIEKIYIKIPQIHFLYSKDNLGFAKGNNIGFQYSKEKYNPDIIVLANNDLIFKQKDFIDRLIDAENSTKFDVAGPAIISLVDNKNQNPVYVVYHNAKEVKKRIDKFKVLYFLSIFNIDKKVRELFGGKALTCGNNGNADDFQLHGACLFFSNNYLKKYDGLYSGTFMYGEEWILKYLIDINNMNMDYLDDLVVYHKEGSSTKKQLGMGKKQRQFFYKNSIASLSMLREMMQKGYR